MTRNRLPLMHIIACLCVIVIFIPNIKAVTITWTGSVDNSWHKTCNWSPAQIPTNADAVIINAVATYPDITATACASTVTINANATGALEIQTAGTLRINGSALNITSAASNVIQILGSGQLNIGPAACTPTTLGGCCTPPTNPLSLTYTPTPVLSSTGNVTLQVNGGSPGTGGTWNLYNGSSCTGGILVSSGTGTFSRPTSCSDQTFSARAIGTCGTSSCVWVTVCRKQGCFISTFKSCDNSVPANVKCVQNNLFADGACSSTNSPSTVAQCSTNPTATWTTSGCGCCCQPKGAAGCQSTNCNGTNYESHSCVASAGWVLVRSYSNSCNYTTTQQNLGAGAHLVTYFNYDGFLTTCVLNCSTPVYNCGCGGSGWGMDGNSGTYIATCT